MMTEPQTMNEGAFGAWSPFVTPLYPPHHFAIDEQGGGER
jgi:hypothetical protein